MASDFPYWFKFLKDEDMNRKEKREKARNLSRIMKSLKHKPRLRLLFFMLVLRLEDEDKFKEEFEKELTLMNKNKRGGQFLYSEALIMYAGITKSRNNYSYRRLIKELEKSFPNFKIPRRSQLHARIKAQEVDILNDLLIIKSKMPHTLAIDASGFRQHAGGRWIEAHYKVERDGFVKMHICIDVNSKIIRSYSITTDKKSDSSQFKQLLKDATEIVDECNRTGKPITKKILADKGYDTKKIHEFCMMYNLINGILIKRNAVSHGDDPRSKLAEFQFGALDGKDLNSMPTDEREENQDDWKIILGYGDRANVEGVFSTMKLLFGEDIKAIKWENMVQELKFKIAAHNSKVILAQVGIEW